MKGKLTRQQAQQQVFRLTANPMLTPQSDDGLKEIVDCLLRHCESIEHAEATMTAFLDSSPNPRNVTAELAAAAKLAKSGPSLPDGCDLCRYREPLTGLIKYRSHISVVVRGYESSKRCACPRGQALEAADRRRDAEQKQRLAAQGITGGVA